MPKKGNKEGSKSKSASKDGPKSESKERTKSGNKEKSKSKSGSKEEGKSKNKDGPKSGSKEQDKSDKKESKSKSGNKEESKSTSVRTKPEQNENVVGTDPSDATIIAFKKEEPVEPAPSSKTSVPLGPEYSILNMSTDGGPDRLTDALNEREFQTSMQKIHERWRKLTKDERTQLNSLYPRSVQPYALEAFKRTEAFRQYSYNIEKGQEENARLPPNRPGMAQSDEDNLKLLPGKTEDEARKHLTGRMTKKQLKEERKKNRHHRHHEDEKSPTPPSLIMEPQEIPPQTPQTVVPALPKVQGPILSPLPPSIVASPTSSKAAGDAKPKPKSKPKPKPKPLRKTKIRRRMRASSSSSSSSSSYDSYPPCVNAFQCQTQTQSGSTECGKSSSGSDSDEGLDFQFCPAHANCATEVTVTIEPDEEIDPLEYALENGICPLICYTMPPCLMVTPNYYQQQQASVGYGWGQNQPGYNGYAQRHAQNGQGYNGYPQQQGQNGQGYNAYPQQQGSNRQNYSGFVPQNPNYRVLQGQNRQNGQYDSRNGNRFNGGGQIGGASNAGPMYGPGSIGGGSAGGGSNGWRNKGGSSIGGGSNGGFPNPPGTTGGGSIGGKENGVGTNGAPANGDETNGGLPNGGGTNGDLANPDGSIDSLEVHANAGFASVPVNSRGERNVGASWRTYNKPVD